MKRMIELDDNEIETLKKLVKALKTDSKGNLYISCDKTTCDSPESDKE